jgi:GR25 family glycosyltransferase involved in LPS biosynthesis
MAERMHVYYINLATQTERRAAVEAELAQLPPDWTTSRVEAVTPATLDPVRFCADLKPGENACCQSHRRAMGMAAAAGGHALVLEDDVQLSPRSAGLIEAAVNSLPATDWDLLFTDVAIPDPEPMLQLFLLRRQAVAENRMHLLNLARLPFCGSTAYVINGASLERVMAVVDANRHGLPYDLLLRQAIFDGELAGRLVFPFPTTVSAAADASQIQAASVQGTDLLWNAYRRLMWIGQDRARVEATLAALPVTAGDAESQLMGRILAAVLSPALIMSK